MVLWAYWGQIIKPSHVYRRLEAMYGKPCGKKSKSEAHLYSSVAKRLAMKPTDDDKNAGWTITSSYPLYCMTTYGVCCERHMAALGAKARRHSLWACVSLCLYGWLWTWRWSLRGRLSGLSALRSSQGLCLCAALELAGSAPTERGEMCLTYAQCTRLGRL